MSPLDMNCSPNEPSLSNQVAHRANKFYREYVKLLITLQWIAAWTVVKHSSPEVKFLSSKTVNVVINHVLSQTILPLT